MPLFNPSLPVVSGAFYVATLALAKNINIPIVIKSVATGGYNAEGDLGGAEYKRVAAQPVHAGKFQSKDGAWWELSLSAVNPFMFGAVNDEVTNNTVTYQACLDTAVAIKAMVVHGTSRRLMVGSLFPKSGTNWVNPILKTINSNSTGPDPEPTPITLDGAKGEIKGVTIIAPDIDGNRVNQLNMQASGGDGNRCGISFYGKGVSDVYIENAKAHNCGTEGIFFFTHGTAPAAGDDFFYKNITINGADLQFNGRHGISLMSIDGVYFEGRWISKNNGKDVAGFASGNYRDAGYGRRFPGNLQGNLYGRALDFESYLLGEGGRNLWFNGSFDFTENAGGSLLFFHKYENNVGFPMENIFFNGNIYIDDLNGAIGDGSCAFFGAGYAGNDTVFRNIVGFISSIKRQGITLYNVDRVNIRIGSANIYGPFPEVMTVTKPGRFVNVTVMTNKPFTGTDGYTLSNPPFDFKTVNQTIGAASPLTVTGVNYGFDASGYWTAIVKFSIQMNALEVGYNFTFPNGIEMESGSVEVVKPNAGFAATGSLVPSGAGPNIIYLSAIGTVGQPISGVMYVRIRAKS